MYNQWLKNIGPCLAWIYLGLMIIPRSFADSVAEIWPPSAFIIAGNGTRINCSYHLDPSKEFRSISLYYRSNTGSDEEQIYLLSSEGEGSIENKLCTERNCTHKWSNSGRKPVGWAEFQMENLDLKDTGALMCQILIMAPPEYIKTSFSKIEIGAIPSIELSAHGVNGSEQYNCSSDIPTQIIEDFEEVACTAIAGHPLPNVTWVTRTGSASNNTLLKDEKPSNITNILHLSGTESEFECVISYQGPKGIEKYVCRFTSNATLIIDLPGQNKSALEISNSGTGTVILFIVIALLIIIGAVIVFLRVKKYRKDKKTTEEVINQGPQYRQV